MTTVTASGTSAGHARSWDGAGGKEAIFQCLSSVSSLHQNFTLQLKGNLFSVFEESKVIIKKLHKSYIYNLTEKH